MIDTVVIAVHSLHKYTKILDILSNIHSKDALKIRKWNMNGKELDADKSYLEFVEIQFPDTDKVNVVAKDKIYLPSSHYKLAWRADYEKNMLEFNFSLPKLIYGTNIVQFVRHHNETMNLDFDINSFNTWNGNVEPSFNRFKSFLDKFFKMYFTWYEKDMFDRDVEKTIDPKDVEIRRIDLAFNQVFDSQRDALEYLELQKRIRKKYERESGNSSRSFKTSVWIQTDRYTAKIYHKGSEYEKNDLKEHQKINQRAGAEIFDTKLLRKLSGRILRYEISFKGKYMSYLYKQSIFRAEDKFWQKVKEIKRYVEKQERKIERSEDRLTELRNKTWQQAGLQSEEERKKEIKRLRAEIYRWNIDLKLYETITCKNKMVDTYKVTNTKKDWYKIAINIESQITHFFWQTSERDRMDGKLTIDFVQGVNGMVRVNNIYPFGIRLFRLMSGKLKEFFEQFQIEQTEHHLKVEMIVRKHNQNAELHNKLHDDLIKKSIVKRIETYSERNIKKWFEMTKINSWDELVQKGLLSKSQKNRLIVAFKTLKLETNAFSTVPVNAPRDFEKYHDLHFAHPFLLRLNHYFN